MNQNKNEKLVKAFTKCLDQRSLKSIKKPLYEFLCTYCGFNTHGSIKGFRAYYSDENFVGFIENWIRSPFVWCSYEEESENKQTKLIMKQLVEDEYDSIVRDFSLNKKVQAVSLLQELAEMYGYHYQYSYQSNDCKKEVFYEGDDGQFCLAL